MNNAHRQLIETLEAMPLDQARKAIASGQFGAIDSPNHSVASAWLAAREATVRDAREDETLSVARKALSNSRWANIISIVAVVISTLTAVGIVIIELRLK